MRHDRLSAIQQWGMAEQAALHNEVEHGLATLASGEARVGMQDFAAGAGRHGAPRA
jgi:enoyl-CoA hydratase